MSEPYPFQSLPDFHKRDCALALIAKSNWHFAGRPVANPGNAELLRWAPEFASTLAPRPEPVNVPPRKEKPVKSNPRATVAKPYRISNAEGAANPNPISNPIGTPATSERMTIKQKRDAVDRALVEHPARSDREHARSLGVSHRFVSLRRRGMGGNVAS